MSNPSSVLNTSLYFEAFSNIQPLQNLIDNFGVDSSLILAPALESAQHFLRQFAVSIDFDHKLAVAFGSEFDVNQTKTFAQSWATGLLSTLPQIEIRSAIELNGAYGAFANATNRIYLSREFLAQNANNTEVVTSVVLEEIGHYVDSQINISDAPGDEGAIFSALVRGEILDQRTLNTLLTEDDSVVLTIDGQVIEIEQATPGINPAFDLIGLTRLRNDSRFAGIDGSGFTVAVIDSGLDRTHPLLQPNYRFGYDFFNNDNNPDDLVTHGTHVSGTVGARDQNIGVAPDVGLIGLKVGDARQLSPTAIVRALQWVLDNHQQYNIVAVNMSLGGGFFTSETQALGDPRIDLINRLERAGVTVVSAAGNSYKNHEYQNFGSPAIFSTLAVGAVWQDGVNSNFRLADGAIDFTTGADRVTSFSQRLNAPNTIFAPGALINSTVPGGRQERKGGTSMASPIVAGAVALMQEAAMQFGGRLLLPAEIVEIMRSTANAIFDGDDENDNVQNTNISYPRLNIYNAIAEIQRRFQQLAPTGDPNGTIQGAYLGPTLNGSPVNPIFGRIGTDGGTVNVGNKDVDIFRFEVVSPGNVTITLSSNPSNPDDFDTFLRLFNSSGQELAFNDDINLGVNTFSSLTTFLNPGVYYAGVSGYNNSAYNPNVAGSGIPGTTGNFAIQFSLSNADPNGLISGAVHVNLGTDRDPLLFNGHIGSDYGTPVGVSDVDLFEIRVPDNGTLFIDIDTPFNNGEYVDSFLRIFDANGNELRLSDDDLSIDGAGNWTEFTDPIYPNLVFEEPFNRQFFHGHTTDSFIAGTVERGDIYYIGVSDYFNQYYNPNSLNGRATGGTGGLYNLIVTFINNDQNGSITQAFDRSVIPLPVTGQPGIIGADTNPQTGQLLEVGDRDVDFVKINSPTAGILEIDIDSYSVSSITDPVDTVALIFDANGNLLAANDDSDGLDALLQYEINANTDYFVAITGYGNDNFDPFQLASGSPGDTGQYIFNSRVLPLADAVILSNETVNNSAVEDVNFNSLVFGSIGEDDDFIIGADDIDLYRFVPTSTGLVNIRTSTSQEFSADTYLRFFNANGNQIAANDNQSTMTQGSFLQVLVTAGTEYFIGVNGASSQAGNYNPITGAGAANGSQGSYTLSLTIPGVNQTGTDAGETLTGGQNNDFLDGRGGNDTLRGLGDNDILRGGSGNDTLDGGLGQDTLEGGAGNDSYIVDRSSDRVTETSNAGVDTVRSAISWTIGANFENLILTGTAGISGTGNTLNNRLTGNNASNSLRGGTGNDVLTGGAGNDSLLGDAGNDSLIGGAGRDRLTGGAGADRIYFYNKTERVDTITDFRVVDDTIYVSRTGFGGGLKAGAILTEAQFKLGSRAGDSSDRFIYNKNTGALFFDVDGTGSSAQTQIAQLSTGLAMTNRDIFVF